MYIKKHALKWSTIEIYTLLLLFINLYSYSYYTDAGVVPAVGYVEADDYNDGGKGSRAFKSTTVWIWSSRCFGPYLRIQLLLRHE